MSSRITVIGVQDTACNLVRLETRVTEMRERS